MGASSAARTVGGHANPCSLTMLISNDPRIRAAMVALDGLAERQRAIADNIANVETPGFLARKVGFENALDAQMASGQLPDNSALSSTRSTAATRTNGNNVYLDDEMVSMQDTQLRYQVMTRFVTGRFDSIRTAVRTT